MAMKQQDRLVSLRVDGEIDADIFANKKTELRDRMASLKLQMDSLDRNRDEMADLVSKVFELSQTLWEKWLTADYHCKRRILEIICLNFRLDDVTRMLRNEKALRRSRRRASCPVESGIQDLNLRPLGPQPSALARLR